MAATAKPVAVGVRGRRTMSVVPAAKKYEITNLDNVPRLMEQRMKLDQEVRKKGPL